MSPKAPPFGLPVNTRTAVEDLGARVTGLEQNHGELEDCVRDRLGRLEVEVSGIKSTVEVLRDMAIEDRQQRTTALQEQGRTERVRYNTRAKIIVALFGVIGVIAGAAATVLAGCV